MIQRKIYTTLFYTLCILGILGAIKNLSAWENKHSRALERNQASVFTVPEKVAPDIVPVSDEETFTQGIPLEISNDTEKVPQTTQQDLLPTEQNPCPSGNPLPEYNELSPVSPVFGLDYYRPNDLVPIPKNIPTPHTICIRTDALVALKDMYHAMHEQGLRPMIVSGFRSSTYQKKIQEKNINQTLKDGTVIRSVALPHHSEHQLGTTIDIAARPNYNIRDLENSPEYAWMIEHAAEYGFVQSYHYGDESLTGYRGEPWHWRYVGPAHAQSVRDTGTVLFQYLENLIKNSEIKKP